MWALPGQPNFAAFTSRGSTCANAPCHQVAERKATHRSQSQRRCHLFRGEMRGTRSTRLAGCRTADDREVRACPRVSLVPESYMRPRGDVKEWTSTPP